MATSRRLFLKTSAALAAGTSLAGLLRADAGESAPARAPKPAPGRGLFFDPEDLPRIRANFDDPRCAYIRKELLDVDLEAETAFLEKTLRLSNHVEHFARVYKDVVNHSLVYAVFGDRRHLALALLALRRLCDYKRWDFYLEGGRDTLGLMRAPHAVMASCCALDWLGDAMPAELRGRVETRIAEEGAPACYRALYGMKHPDRVRGWGFDPEDEIRQKVDFARWPLIINSTNIKALATFGLGFAAVTFHGRRPAAAKWLQLARQSARSFASLYGDDGCFDEGIAYWGSTTFLMVAFAEVLYRRLGIDDRRLINYPGTVRYALALTMPCAGGRVPDPKAGSPYDSVPRYDYMPSTDAVNFGDASSAMDVTLAPWVGGTENDPLSNYVARTLGELRLFASVIWYRPDAPVAKPGPELCDLHLNNDLVLSRSGWTANDAVVALRSGGPSNHEHADRNSVIFKAYGERLFHDPFKASYTYTHPRWLLRQTEAHTAVLIDGKGHQYHDGHEGTNASWAEASVADFRTGAGWMLVTSDATPAYQLVDPSVERITRSLLFLKPDVLVILDHIRLSAAAPVQLRFQVFNEDNLGRASVESTDGFSITRPHSGLLARTAGTGALSVREGRLALPADEGVFPYAEVVSAPATEHVVVTAAAAAPSGERPGALTLERTGDAWKVAGEHRGRRIAATLRLEPSGIAGISL